MIETFLFLMSLILLVLIEFFFQGIVEHLLRGREFLSIFRFNFCKAQLSQLLSQFFKIPKYFDFMNHIQLTLLFALIMGHKFNPLFNFSGSEISKKIFIFFFWFSLFLTMIEYVNNKKSQLLSLLSLVLIATLSFMKSLFLGEPSLIVKSLLLLFLLFQIRRLTKIFENYGWLQALVKVLGISFAVGYSFDVISQQPLLFIALYLVSSIIMLSFPSKSKIYYWRDSSC